MALLIENNAYSRVAASLAIGATTLIVDTGTGDRFPIAGSGNYFKLTLQDAANNIEIIKVNARAASSDSMTIERAQEGTTARAWNIGDIVELRLTAGVTAPLQVLEEANTAALIRGKIDVPTRTGGDATGTWGISITGNAASATVLQTARTINGVSFNGSANITITANTPNSLTPGAFLTGSAFNGSAAQTFAVDATNLNTANKVVARDASGNFSAGTITAALAGNASTATALQTARTINGVSFNGTANINVNLNNSIAFNNGGAGVASGGTFNGGSAVTVSYNTVGAPSTTGTGASGTWGISITGNAATATTATNQSGGTVDATTATGDRFNNRGFFGASQSNATNHFTQANAGNLALTTGWIAAAYGDNLSDRVVIGQGSQGAILGAHNEDLTAWATLILNPNASGRVVIGTFTDDGVTKLQVAGNVSATTFVGSLSGNASSATILQTARTINGVSFNGSANISINLNNSLTAGNGLTGTTFNGGAASTFAIGTPTSVSNTSTDSVTATSHTHALVGELVETTSGTAVYYGARAWVNFNGVGALTVRASANVSSVSDNGVGDYSVNFSTAMPDTNYSVQAAAGDPGAACITVTLNRNAAGLEVAPTTTSFRLLTAFDNGAGQITDSKYTCLSIFR